MNIAEAAKYLFVNRPHVRKLVERCVLAGKSTKHRSKNMRRPGTPGKRAAKGWFDSQTEDNDPLGL
jgi:hypothetical protein